MEKKVLVVLLVLAVIPVLCSQVYSAPASSLLKCEDTQDPKIDPYVYGEVKVNIYTNRKITNTFTYPDKCKNDTTVYDKFCIEPNKGMPGGKYIQCKSGDKCQDGKCVPPLPPEVFLNAVIPTWIYAEPMESEYFTCGSSGFVLILNVKGENPNLGPWVYDCGGDGQIDYVNNEGAPTYSLTGWLPEDQFAKYQPYLDAVIKSTKERLAAVVSSLGNINYSNTTLYSPAPYPSGNCDPSTMFFIHFGSSKEVSLDCQIDDSGDCKMYGMILDYNGPTKIPFILWKWDDLWTYEPPNYLKDVVTIMNALIDKLPEEITADCNGQEIDINFVK